MTSQRVAFLAPHARAVDGWGRYTVELATEVRRHGVEPVLFTAERAVDPELRGVEHHPVLPPLFAGRFALARTLGAAPRLRRLAASCDVVHVIAEPYLPVAALAATRRQSVVATAHGTWAVRPFDSWRRAFWSAALRRIDLLVCQSHFTRDAMARRAALPRSIVLPAGVRMDRFTRRPGSERPPWLSPGPVVLSVSALKARKGIDVALDAAALARRAHPHLQLVVAGQGDGRSPYVQALEARAVALGIRDAFHRVGVLPFEALADWYHRADVFLLLPIAEEGAFEGLGLVYLEAAACGVPSIGTRGCGAEDAIVDNETGMLVPPGDAAAAGAALDLLLSRPDLRARLGTAARAHAQAASWTRLAKALAGEYALASAQGRGET